MSLEPANRLGWAYLRAAEELRKNPGQWRAYESTGHCVMLAGPGSGKTKTLTIKMARMLAEDVQPPRGIACITYSSECARELKRRLSLLGIHESQRVFIGTLHSFCLRNILLPYGRLVGLSLPYPWTVASLDEQDTLFRRALDKVVPNENPYDARTRADRYRRTLVDRDVADWWTEDSELAELVETYENLLHKSNFIDFDDMILHGLRVVEKNEWVRKVIRARFPILVVDEYQDLGVPLHRIVLSLCVSGGVRLLAVGDPDQSIYGFTGAKPDLLNELPRALGVEPIRLRFNYRSGSTIVYASEAALGEKRGYEAVSGYAGTIDFHKCPEGIREQAELICGVIIPSALSNRSGRHVGDIAVLYSSKYDGDVIAEQADLHQIKYIRIDKGAPYPKTPLTRWLEDCAQWCGGGWINGTPSLSSLIQDWLRFNLTSRTEGEVRNLKLQLVRFLFSHRGRDISLSQWITEFEKHCLCQLLEKEPLLHDEATALGRLKYSCGGEGKLSDYTVSLFGCQIGAPDHLNLITLHSAKGLEFDVVVMMGMEQGAVPHWSARTAVSKREPRRLFYVGLTRARHEVHLTYSGWRPNPYGPPHNDGPSEFLIEVYNKLEEDGYLAI